MPVLLGTVLNHLVEARERATTDEQDAGGVDLQEFLLRVLAATLRRHAGNGAFDQLQQGLLHAFAGHITGNRRIFRLAGNLVDFVDVDDAALRLLDVVITLLQQALDDVLDVFTDITGFGEGGRISDRERHVEQTGQRFGEQRLARTGRADQQDVRLRQFHAIRRTLLAQTLVVVVDGDRQHFLGLILANHVFIEDRADFLRFRQALDLRLGVNFLADDVVAQIDAFVADVHRRARNQLADFVLALPAERAIQHAPTLRAAAYVVRHFRPQSRF